MSDQMPRHVEECIVDRTELRSKVDHQLELVDLQWSAQAEALRLASASTERRFQDIAQQLEKVFSQLDELQRYAGNQNVGATINSLESKVFSELNTVRQKVEDNAKPNYILGASIITALIGAIGGLWTVTGLKIDNAIAPLAVQIEQTKSANAAQDRSIASIENYQRDYAGVIQKNTARLDVSASDREQLNDRLHSLEVDVIIHESENEKIFARLESMITRLNVWADFLHAKLFPDTPRPPSSVKSPQQP